MNSNSAGVVGDRSRVRKTYQYMLELSGALPVLISIAVAAELGIADILADGPMRCDQVCAIAGCDHEALERLLCLLAGMGIFRRLKGGEFENSDLSNTLRTGGPFSARDWFRLMTRPFYWTTWSELLGSVRTGKPGFDELYGSPFFEWLQNWPAEQAIFQDAMSNITAPAIQAVAAAYDFGFAGSIVDIGGGDGSALLDLLERNPNLIGSLVESPGVIEKARKSGALIALEAQQRLFFCSSDMFEFIPGGGDLYIMKWILHDWNDRDAVRLLRRCRSAMAEGSRLLIIETLLDEDGPTRKARGFDVGMLVLTGGLERTLSHYRELLDAAGLQLTRVIETESMFTILEAV